MQKISLSPLSYYKYYGNLLALCLYCRAYYCFPFCHQLAFRHNFITFSMEPFILMLFSVQKNSVFQWQQLAYIHYIHRPLSFLWQMAVFSSLSFLYSQYFLCVEWQVISTWYHYCRHRHSLCRAFRPVAFYCLHKSNASFELPWVALCMQLSKWSTMSNDIRVHTVF